MPRKRETKPKAGYTDNCGRRYEQLLPPASVYPAGQAPSAPPNLWSLLKRRGLHREKRQEGRQSNTTPTEHVSIAFPVFIDTAKLPSEELIQDS